jgi:hypothetical protein
MADEVATKRARGNATPKDELVRRWSIVEDLIAAGMPTQKICAELERQKGWPPTTVYRYVHQVRRRWLAEHEADRETAAVARIARLQSLSFKAERKEAWAAVGTFERLLCQIHGVLAPERVDHRVAAVVTQAPLPQPADLEIVERLPDEVLDALERALDEHARALPANAIDVTAAG